MSELPLWRRVTGIVGGIVLSAIIGLALIPTGQVAVFPREPTVLTGRVEIDNEPGPQLQGRVSFVGVEEQPVRLLHKWWLQLREEDIAFAPEPKKDARRESNGIATEDADASTELTLAKRVASGIAFDLAGKPVDWRGTNATITDVEPNSPAAQAGLKGGDSVIFVDGVEVDNSVDAGKILFAHQPGENVQLVIRRNGLDTTKTLTTIPPPPGDSVHNSVIGASLDTIGLQVDLPQSVSINSGGLVGTSGALAFALYVYDAVAKDDLAAGRAIVATGALAEDGLVLPVQRVKQKAVATQRSGADVLLVPLANVDEAVAGVRAACSSDVRCVRVVPVTSVAHAIDLLNDEDKLRRAERDVQED